MNEDRTIASGGANYYADHRRDGGHEVRILLVEDNELNRDMLSRRLKKRGYEIEIAIDGQQGIDMARSSNPNLILLDMSLPVVDGWDAARTLKSGEDTKGIPIIALTAHAMAGDREKALEAGCDDYDTKPVELPRLLEKIGHWIEG
ncbi:response regulator [Aliiroseovarius sp. KMU-50]|uniref:Response regulator n=1 Tax=Aliiroseovarius salicola TaxID=3009082 RepID=A0ABT4VZY1_9RHOB|nr:response regulator [Aliiroseovarius sp. KMU-50]MDA5093724.1 response regulator [Aliiroseovarius sp. KMU-50]